MDISQLAAAKQTLLDAETRKQRSPSFSKKMSKVVQLHNTRLAGPLSRHKRPTISSVAEVFSPPLIPQKPVPKVLESIVDRHDNFSSMAYVKSPPSRCFGPVAQALAEKTREKAVRFDVPEHDVARQGKNGDREAVCDRRARQNERVGSEVRKVMVMCRMPRLHVMKERK